MSVCLLLNIRILPVTTPVMEIIKTRRTLKTILLEKPDTAEKAMKQIP
jgi:hypothetical protein